MAPPLRLLLRRPPHGRHAFPHPPIHHVSDQRPRRLTRRNLRRLPLHQPHRQRHDLRRCQGQESECGCVQIRRRSHDDLFRGDGRRGGGDASREGEGEGDGSLESGGGVDWGEVIWCDAE
ncbi:hypothetical protein LINPERPRIM_LOCUS2036 [Linum perenne]